MHDLPISNILDGNNKESLQTKKSWQRKFFAKKDMQRKQRKILLINPQFCTYFEKKLPISWNEKRFLFSFKLEFFFEKIVT